MQIKSKNNAKRTLETVSYTHLDVYKRQILKWFRQKELNIPTFYVMGEEDYMFLPAVKKVVEAHSKSSTLLVIENCGHVVNVDKPHIFNEKVIEFISKQSA